MTTTATLCPRHGAGDPRVVAGHDGTLCEHHVAALSVQLRALPHLYDELGRLPPSSSPDPGRLTGTPAVLDPINTPAVVLQLSIRDVLVGWVHVVVEARGIVGPRNRSIAGRAAWLAGHAPWFGRHDAGPAILDEVAGLVKAAEAVLFPRERAYVGPCLGDIGNGLRCGRDLHVREGEREVRCWWCGATYDTEAHRARLHAESADHLATAAEIAGYISLLGHRPVPRNTVNQWARRKRLHTRGRSSSGLPLYRVGDAVALFEDAGRR